MYVVLRLLHNRIDLPWGICCDSDNRCWRIASTKCVDDRNKVGNEHSEPHWIPCNYTCNWTPIFFMAIFVPSLFGRLFRQLERQEEEKTKRYCWNYMMRYWWLTIISIRNGEKNGKCSIPFGWIENNWTLYRFHTADNEKWIWKRDIFPYLWSVCCTDVLRVQADYCCLNLYHTN